ncbi:TPA: hypothetical protein DEP90_01790, partial [Patescibacteria group bacterium]|nr:hypothetical protein [Patescibacteria group bacterium]
ESKNWFLKPEETLRIDLKDIIIFDTPKSGHSFKSLEWNPSQGGSTKISERDYNIILGKSSDVIEKDIDEDFSQKFYLERYLEEFLVSNWENINLEDGLEIFEDDDGNFGQQYYTSDVGYIDILARDKNGNFVVIELKKGRKNDEVVGQVLRYMGWVKNHLAKNNENVRGLIIVGEKDPKLEYALEMVKDKVSLKLYSINFKLKNY